MARLVYINRPHIGTCVEILVQPLTMPTSQNLSVLDLSKTVAIIHASHDQAARAFNLPHNNAYSHVICATVTPEPTNSFSPGSREQTLHLSPQPRHQIWLTLDQPPRDPVRGWAFGSDATIADVLLAPNWSRALVVVIFEFSRTGFIRRSCSNVLPTEVCASSQLAALNGYSFGPPRGILGRQQRRQDTFNRC